MLKVWLSSFISGIDWWRVPIGLASPQARRDQQGWPKDRVEIRLGGGALAGKSGFSWKFRFFVISSCLLVRFNRLRVRWNALLLIYGIQIIFLKIWWWVGGREEVSGRQHAGESMKFKENLDFWCFFSKCHDNYLGGLTSDFIESGCAGMLCLWCME